MYKVGGYDVLSLYNTYEYNGPNSCSLIITVLKLVEYVKIYKLTCIHRLLYFTVLVQLSL
jgi:hypothetical protein